MNRDVMTDVIRDDDGKWFVLCETWDEATAKWQTAERLTGFKTRKAAVEAARAWRRGDR